MTVRIEDLEGKGLCLKSGSDKFFFIPDCKNWKNQPQPVILEGHVQVGINGFFEPLDRPKLAAFLWNPETCELIY